jgi:rhodanese-related sulfurtransferase
MGIGQMGPRELRERLAAGDVTVVDVREAWELELARLPEAVHIPLGELPERLDELPRDRELVFLCHHGVRSLQACFVAKAAGLRTTNLSGGIAAWTAEVDPTVPEY